MAVLVDLDDAVLWRPTDALIDATPSAIRVQDLYLFSHYTPWPHRRLRVVLITPEGARTQWRQAVAAPSPLLLPPFDPEEIRQAAEHHGTVEARLEGGLDGTLHILVGCRHLDWRACLEGARMALKIVAPDVAEQYTVDWERDVPDGLPDALYRESELRARARTAETRSEHLSLRAAADDLWLEEVGPLLAEADTTRRIHEPGLHRRRTDAQREAEERQSENGAYAPAGRFDRVPGVIVEETHIHHSRQAACDRLRGLLDPLARLGVDAEPAIRALE